MELFRTTNAILVSWQNTKYRKATNNKTEREQVGKEEYEMVKICQKVQLEKISNR